MDQDEFKLAIWKWATTVLNPGFDVESTTEEPGILVIEADSDGPRPKKAYLTYNIIATGEPGLPSKDTVTDAGEQDVYFDRLPTVNFQGYMKNAEGYLYQLKESICLQSTMELIQGLGFTVHNIEDVQDVSALVDETREKRWSMDVMCNYGRKVVDSSAGKIETIDYTGNFLPPE